MAPDRKRKPDASTTPPRVAVLYQAIDPPVINGVTKPRKPGGYRDSGADIAYVLGKSGVQVITPTLRPDPTDDGGWCFPDSEEGILSAIQSGATHLWANTILFAAHPLQASRAITKYADSVQVVGQPPSLVELFDDKEYTNNLLRKHTKLPLPTSYTIDTRNGRNIQLPSALRFPIVAKPIRGRGSHGVRVCHDKSDLLGHLSVILQESPVVMLESFLAGEEATIAVMPPSSETPRFWALPVVTRFNHELDIAPYNGVKAVTSNSRVLSWPEFEADAAYAVVSRQCEQVAKLLNVTAPIRIDVRRFDADRGSPFAIFDINMKPNMTGPGRPGREDQDSLVAMAAKKLGWDYPRLLREVLSTAKVLTKLRELALPSPFANNSNR
ncbi:hypothetical protein B0T16DRAFT_424258 [Cercophora newfieldiana]|uniref:ATP-grasp domain-containing protein n=1 Tax=Cercophora newfieldiana TaxID=92897 RepID=A0AA39YMP4_9PEZI|nr:hypothetical protein B0T16DRAFT_424258 [Cercophora newfieldiana]